MKIFVGNLNFGATNEDVKKLFEAFGAVTAVSLKKKSGGNPRGFGFVEMSDYEMALKAIAELNGKDFMGRPLVVMPKRPTPDKPRKDYKEIKRKKQEAKLAASQPISIAEDAPVIRPKRPASAPRRSRGPKVWEKRKGTGKSAPWKKKPGGVKKTFPKSR